MNSTESKARSEYISSNPIYPITIQLGSNGLVARQMNNVIHLDSLAGIKASDLLINNSCACANVSLDLLTTANKNESLVINPITFCLFSSYGAMFGAKMTVRQPSEGIWTLAENLSRTIPQATSVCIDPNLMSVSDLIKNLRQVIYDESRTVLGFSVLPQNLVNDARFISELHKAFPKARLLVGGLGSNSLELIPTVSGQFGIDKAFPIEAIIPGPAILELNALARNLYNDPTLSSEKLKEIVLKASMEYSSYNWASIQEELTRSRANSQMNFIPHKPRKRLFFKKSYSELQEADGNRNDARTILTDNNCLQKCWFCSTPKDSRFSTWQEEYDFIKTVPDGATAIAFNNNDLASNPEKTIWLCEQMAENSELQQPKYGKISVSTYNEPLILALKKANFVRIAIGVETFVGKDRGYLKGKNFLDTEAIRKTLAKLLEVGIIPEINLILFHPKETRESLKTTVQEALTWVEKGSIVNVNLGINAIPNSYAVSKFLSKLIEKNPTSAEIENEMNKKFETVEIAGNEDSILFPVQWKCKNPEIEALKHSIKKARLNIIRKLSKFFTETVQNNYLTIESYIAIALLGQQFELEGFKTQTEVQQKIESYISKFQGQVYVGI